jgi:type I restriction enzyme S subunit
VNTKDVKNLKLLIPFLSEQNKIAGFLGAVDEWIENLRKQKDQLEQYKKGMMQKIFSQEIRFKDANGKPFPKWEEGKVSEILKSISTRNHQIKSSEIMDLGKYKVLDQGKELVAGYSNEASKILHKSPVIIFGDHTGALKYINFDFIVGADGTKVLSLKQEDNNLLFVYYTIQANQLKT